MQFTAFTFNILWALSLGLLVAASPTSDESQLVTIQSIEQFKDWLENTDADITYSGVPIPDLSDLSKRNALATMVTYCNKRVNNVCGGTCNVYNGGPTCLNAPGTSCLAATNNVGFCDHSGCSGSCNQFSTCGTHLDNGFCFTPGTKSILVGNA